MKLCSDFFGDFHVIGIELICTAMSSFENKKPVHRMLFVHSKLEKMGKKWAFDFVQLHICCINEVRAKLIENINIHMEPFEENNLLFKIVYFCFYQ